MFSIYKLNLCYFTIIEISSKSFSISDSFPVVWHSDSGLEQISIILKIRTYEFVDSCLRRDIFFKKYKYLPSYFLRFFYKIKRNSYFLIKARIRRSSLSPGHQKILADQDLLHFTIFDAGTLCKVPWFL